MAKLIECKSEIGTTVGLIDSIIVLTRLLDMRLDYNAMVIGTRGDKYQPIRSALNDLLNNSPYRKIIDGRDDEAAKIIHDAAELLASAPPSPLSSDATLSAGKDGILSERASQTEILCACTDSCAKDAEIERLTAENERLRGAAETSRQAIAYSMDMGTTDPAGVLLQALNKCDAALPQHHSGAEKSDG